MDQFKVFIAVMKKQHFWVMTGLVLIVGLTGWAMATSTLSNEYKTSRSKIESAFKDLDQLRSQERENQDWISGIQVEAVKLKAKVKAAWDDVYSEQRDKVLRWPNVLGDDFLRTVPQLSASEDIPIDQRERYWNYAREEFPRLLGIVDARSYLDKSEPIVKPRGVPGGRLGQPGKERAAEDGEASQHDFIVRWDKKDQEAIDDRLEWNATPTSQEVRQTQEDLWVYQSLLTIIQHLNDRADGHHNAKVKEIRSLLIGHDAALRFQEVMAEERLEHPEAPGAKPGPAGLTGMPGAGGTKARMPMPQVGGMPGGMPGMPGMPGGPQIGRALDEGRYVDEKGMPLAAGAAAPPEFKRMPIVMQLLIDEREISRLLVESANSPLPVEVRQLRVKAIETEGSVLDARGGAMRGGAGKIAAGRGGGQRQGEEVSVDDERDKSPYDVLVELQGIIYIFNPPDQVKLAPTAAGEPSAAPEESTDASAPADSEPAQTTDPALPEEPAAQEPPSGSSDASQATDEEPAADPAPVRKKPRPKAKQPADKSEGNAKPAEVQPGDPDASEARPDEER